MAAIFITHQHQHQHVTKISSSSFFKLLLRELLYDDAQFLPRNHTWVWIPLKLNTNHIGKYMSGKVLPTEKNRIRKMMLESTHKKAIAEKLISN